MRKILLVAFMACFSLMSLKAFAENNSQTDSLNMKIDVLSHDLDYLRLTHEIYALNTDLKIVTIEIDNNVKDIKINFYQSAFDKDLYRSYERLYNSYRDNLDSYKELINAKSSFFIAKVLTCNFTDSEMDLLFKNYGLTDGLYGKAESSLNMMKSALDLYYKYM